MGVNRVELTGDVGRQVLTVNGHELPCTAVTIHAGARSIPEVDVDLPATDGIVVSLDARVNLSGETREALISMGWTPPAEQPPGPTPATPFRPTSEIV